MSMKNNTAPVSGASKNSNTKTGICYVIGAGDNYGLDFCPSKEDYVIAVDAGLSYLESRNIPANLVIGDFDTLNYIPDLPNVMVLNPEKNDTDTLAAIREGMRRGYATFHIYCGTGGRIDHTLANLQTLAFLSESHMRGFLFDKDYVVTSITNDRLCFGEIPDGYLSVFSYSQEASGVDLRGLKYELENAVLTNTFPIGTSNEFTGKESTISVKDGTLLVVFPRNAMGEIVK